LSGNSLGTPLALCQNVTHNRVLHERNIILAVETAEIPHVPEHQRLECTKIGDEFYRAALTYGFMEVPDVPRDLLSATSLDIWTDRQTVSFFVGKETLLATPRSGMYMWRESLFAFMSRNAQSAIWFFKLPAEQVVEVGVQVEL
jgi:KUP system potassium uptake protein